MSSGNSLVLLTLHDDHNGNDMQENNREMFDEDREEVLRLILCEASGIDVRQELAAYPSSARSMFRKVVHEAGLVQSAGLVTGDTGELLFKGPLSLTPRGRKRLDEINARHEAPGDTHNGHDAADDLVDDDDDDDDDDEIDNDSDLDRNS